MKFLTVLVVTLAAQLAFAAGGGHGEAHDAIPVTAILWQLLNVAMLFAGIIYFARKPIIGFFKDMKKNHLETATKSQGLKQQAEREFNSLQKSLDKLKNGAADSIQRAKADALDLRNSIEQEARDLSARVKSEAEKTVITETQKLERELRATLITEATQAAYVELKNIPPENIVTMKQIDSEAGGV